MRTILLLLLSSGIACAQEFPYNSDGLVVYEKILEKPGFTMEEIFVYSKEWIANTFESTKSVIQTEDKEAGEIIGIGYSSSKYAPKGGWGYVYSIDMKFRVNISSRDGKARIRFYDINRVYEDSYAGEVNTPIETFDRETREKRNKRVVSGWINLLEVINTNYKQLIDSYDNSLNKSKKDHF